MTTPAPEVAHRDPVDILCQCFRQPRWWLELKPTEDQRRAGAPHPQSFALLLCHTDGLRLTLYIEAATLTYLMRGKDHHRVTLSVPQFTQWNEKGDVYLPATTWELLNAPLQQIPVVVTLLATKTQESLAANDGDVTKLVAVFECQYGDQPPNTVQCRFNDLPAAWQTELTA